jgi:hypothetical protein
MADKVKRHPLYAGFINETKRLRGTLSLDKPEFIAGVKYYDVLSDAPKR